MIPSVHICITTKATSTNRRRSLAPKYDELGELFKPFGSQVTIAKVDATANDVPDEISGFPTIKLFAAGKKDAPLTYQGSRTVEDLAAFVKDSGSHGVDALAHKPAAAEDADESTDAPHQAPAATESEEGGAADAAKAAAGVVVDKVQEVVGDGEAAPDVHDEL